MATVQDIPWMQWEWIGSTNRWIFLTQPEMAKTDGPEALAGIEADHRKIEPGMALHQHEVKEEAKQQPVMATKEEAEAQPVMATKEEVEAEPEMAVSQLRPVLPGTKHMCAPGKGVSTWGQTRQPHLTPIDTWPGGLQAARDGSKEDNWPEMAKRYQTTCNQER